MKRCILVALLLLGGCSTGSGGTTGPTGVTGLTGPTGVTGGGGVSATIFLTVDGPAQAGITYTNENGDIQQDNNATLPWTKTFTATPGTILELSAQNSAGGTITCEIDVGGTAHTGTAHGQYAICSASAQA